MVPFILIVLLSTIAGATHSEAPWNYNDLGPDVWSDSYPSCAGRSQSPINIQTACTTYQRFSPFRFSSAFNSANDFTLLNNGHTITGTYKGNNSSSLHFRGGNFDRPYVFVNFHLHWGPNRKSGNEHHINGVKHAGEIHFVFNNSETGQTAVLAVFMNSTRDANIEKTSDNYQNLEIEEWKKYFTVAGDLRNRDASVDFRTNLGLLLGKNLDEFWRYKGSLTSPPCTQNVIWTIIRKPILFTESEIGRFRKNILFQDYREPQPLYDRVVYQSFPEKIVSQIPDYKICSKKYETR